MLSDNYNNYLLEMHMTTQIFNNQGFLTAEGKSFINDGFSKEVKKIMATAHNAEDVLTISCILKALVGDAATNKCLDFQVAKQEVVAVKPTSLLYLVKDRCNVIVFPSKTLSEMGEDLPPIDQE